MIENSPRTPASPVPTLEMARETLRRVFGYPSFRPLQEKAIESVLARKDTLLVLPTGGGKSVCYQIPGLLFPGLTIVVSPLISLMKDQVGQLQALGVRAALLNSTLEYSQAQAVKQMVRTGQVKLLYLAPESLLRPDILDLVSKANVRLLAVDEAHCISEWGHDFRPEYRMLVQLRERVPEASWIALTATATRRVRDDIRRVLRFREGGNVVIGSFDRRNLFLEVRPRVKPQEQVLEVLERFRGEPGIVYCMTRKQVDELSAFLVSKGVACMPYHAGLSDEARQAAQDKFLRDDVQVIVATIAFGMGVHKSNVRFVIHHDLPKSLESYYQEIGRAGRDGLPAHCLLLFSHADIRRAKFFLDQATDEKLRKSMEEHLYAMVHYAETDTCRRIPLLRHFGEEPKLAENGCGACDRCVKPAEEEGSDITDIALLFLTAVDLCGQNFGAEHIIDVLRGTKSEKAQRFDHDSLPVFGKGKKFTRAEWSEFRHELLRQALVRRDADHFGVLRITALGLDVLHGHEQVSGRASLVSRKPSPTDRRRSLVEAADPALFDLLKKKRKELADELGVPPYVIFHDTALLQMSELKPQNEHDSLNITGVGEKKLERFGEEFLSVIRRYTR